LGITSVIPRAGRLAERVGRVSPASMSEVDNGLRLALSL
jgi:mRNA-degrading endonuclease toxin of MazEF toxin-antitoxin module